MGHAVYSISKGLNGISCGDRGYIQSFVLAVSHRSRSSRFTESSKLFLGLLPGSVSVSGSAFALWDSLELLDLPINCKTYELAAKFTRSFQYSVFFFFLFLKG